jgi:phage-related protein
MPHVRAMPSIGERCYELRVQDQDQSWRILYRIDDDAIIIAEVFSKKTQKTPARILSAAKKRLSDYDH